MINLDDDELAELWSARISRSQNFRKQVVGDTWTDNRRMLLGEDVNEAVSDGDYEGVVNILWHIIRTFLPALYLDDPYFVVRAFEKDAEVQELEKRSRWFQALLNEYKIKIGTKREVRKSVLDALLYGFGVAKIGWTPIGYNISGGSNIIHFEQSKRKRKNDMPFLKRVSPINFLPDPDVSSFEDCKWVVERSVRPYLSVERNREIYDLKAVKQLDKISADLLLRSVLGKKEVEGQGGVSVNLPTAGGDYEKYVILWEVTSLEEDYFATFGETTVDEGQEFGSFGNGKGLILLRKTDRIYKDILDGLHYFPLYFNEVPDVLYPPSDVEMIAELQKQLTYMRKEQLEHLKKYRSFWLYGKDTISQEELEKLEKAENNSLIAVENIEELEKAIIPLRVEVINPQLYALQPAIKEEIWETAGVSPAGRGATMRGETATAVGQREQYIDVRLNDRVLLIKSWLEEIFTGITRLIGYYAREGADETDMLEAVVEQPGGGTELVEYSVSQIPNRFQIILEVSNTFPLNRQAELVNFMRAVNLFQNNPFVDTRELAIRAFDLFGLKNIPKLVPSMMIPQQVIELLQTNPQILAMMMQIAQQVGAGTGARPADVNAPGNIPAVGMQGMQGGLR